MLKVYTRVKNVYIAMFITQMFCSFADDMFDLFKENFDPFCYTFMYSGLQLMVQ